jgi:thioredoxin-like negative regulator of GroEL
MAPEFEEAANELKGKVRFVKIDTDKEPEMAGRLNVMGLPTLMFLDESKAEAVEGEAEDNQPKAVLKDRIEGALRKDSILALCDYHFFDGPRPQQL